MIFRSFKYPTAWISASYDSQRITLVDESCLAIGASLRAISSGLMVTISSAVLFSTLTNSYGLHRNDASYILDLNVAGSVIQLFIRVLFTKGNAI